MSYNRDKTGRKIDTFEIADIDKITGLIGRAQLNMTSLFSQYITASLLPIGGTAMLTPPANSDDEIFVQGKVTIGIATVGTGYVKAALIDYTDGIQTVIDDRTVRFTSGAYPDVAVSVATIPLEGFIEPRTVEKGHTVGLAVQHIVTATSFLSYINVTGKAYAPQVSVWRQ